jgi:hypothetical protein
MLAKASSVSPKSSTIRASQPAVSGSITSVCWYGAYLPNVAASDSFTIRYYDCVDGVPSENPIAEFTGAGLTGVQRQDTGELVAATAPIYEYIAGHAGVAVTAGTEYFIEIVNSFPADPDQAWFWEFSTDAQGDDESYQKPDVGLPYARYFGNETDLAFCLNIELGDLTVTGCDRPEPSLCDVDTSDADFFENEACGADPDENLGCTEAQPGPFPFTALGNLSFDPQDPTRVAGMTFADGGTRDIDWYSYTVPVGVDADADGLVILCLAIAGEQPIKAVAVDEDQLDGECGDTFIATLDSVGFDCGVSLAIGYTIDLADLDHYILVREADFAELFEGNPCGGSPLGNEYEFTASLVDDDAFDSCFEPLPCPWDIAPPGDPDGDVGFADLTQTLIFWGPCSPDPPGCPGDYPTPPSTPPDGDVGFNDLTQLLINYGPCPTFLPE